MRRVVLGLGSNLGDRQRHLEGAVEAFNQSPAFADLKRSHVRETAPQGGPPQPPYLNAAIVVRTALDARSILEFALRIERQLGRVRPDAVRWGPRIIDIDLLWIENEIVSEPGLEVPHPRLRERAFALEPLLDVAPDAFGPAARERGLITTCRAVMLKKLLEEWPSGRRQRF